MTEAELLSRTLLLGNGDLRLWRNQCGEGWLGMSTRYDRVGTATLQPGDVVVRRARRVRFGIGNPGGADIIGFHRHNIDGRWIARFVAIELKSETGTATPEQKQFVATVANMGGEAGIAYNEADVRRILLL